MCSIATPNATLTSSLCVSWITSLEAAARAGPASSWRRIGRQQQPSLDRRRDWSKLDRLSLRPALQEHARSRAQQMPGLPGRRYEPAPVQIGEIIHAAIGPAMHALEITKQCFLPVDRRRIARYRDTRLGQRAQNGSETQHRVREHGLVHRAPTPRRRIVAEQLGDDPAAWRG